MDLVPRGRSARPRSARLSHAAGAGAVPPQRSPAAGGDWRWRSPPSCWWWRSSSPAWRGAACAARADGRRQRRAGRSVRLPLQPGGGVRAPVPPPATPAPCSCSAPAASMATAARVAAFRGAINRATAGTGIDPNLLEGLVFLESAGRPQAIAGIDPADAAGLTQILAATGQSLLGMHIDLARSRRLTTQIDARCRRHAAAAGSAALLARRAAVDDRFNPTKALAATVRYLTFAEQPVRAPGPRGRVLPHGNRQPASGAGRLRRRPARPLRAALLRQRPDAPRRRLPALAELRRRLVDVLLARARRGADHAPVPHRPRRAAPPERTPVRRRRRRLGAAPPTSTPFADPAALAAAYQHRAMVPLPSNAAALGLASTRRWAPAPGASARRGRCTAACGRWRCAS